MFAAILPYLVTLLAFSNPKSQHKSTKSNNTKGRRASIEHIPTHVVAEHDPCDLHYLQVESFHYVTAKMEIAEYSQEHQDLHSAFDDIDRLTLTTLRSSHIVTIMYH